MKMTPAAVAGLATDQNMPPAHTDRFTRHDGRSPRTRPLMRKYEIAHLTDTNMIEETTRIAPALPAFEDCFAALGRGAILQTSTGPVAIEDLLPGDEIITSSSGPQKLLWKGTMTIVPGSQNTRPEMGTLTRVTTDAFGMGRPGPDLVLGPSARILHRAPGIKALTGSEVAFVPVRDFIDASQIVELTPATAVQIYQLGFAQQERIMVNGLELESLHPGAVHNLGLRSDMQQLLLTLFPHMFSLADFGMTLHPRIRLRDLDLFQVA